MKNYIKYIATFVIAAIALGYLVVSGMEDKLYYKNISELKSFVESTSKSSDLKVIGEVCSENFTVNPGQKYAEFQMSEDGDTINVVYNGVIPSSFTSGIDIIVEGSYDLHNNLFSATSMIVKCPSKYEAEGSEHPEDISINN